jgi:tRNA nucleotidyltransferase/poly(A) polymerase
MDFLTQRPGLRALCFDVFRPAGYDLRVVGGFVRARLLGVKAKDLDLCTDADPETQMRLYRQAGIRFVETGLQHGTLTVILPREEPYEITSLRADEEPDGRHAKTRYGVDWKTDLGRRDLTYNAIALTFEGEFVDPFGGQDDLRAGRTRFVGDPQARMREDYLRILRWIRFHGQITPDAPLDPAAEQAAIDCAPGLRQISRERVWSEMARIVIGPKGPEMIETIRRLGLAEPIDLPNGSHDSLRTAYAGMSWLREHPDVAAPKHDASALLGAFLGSPAAVEELSRTWRWSVEERQEGVYVAKRIGDASFDLKREVAVYRQPQARVVRLAAMQGRYHEARALAAWRVPEKPLKGQDLLDAGMQPGPKLGPILRDLIEAWAASGYTLTKDDLLNQALSPSAS